MCYPRLSSALIAGLNLRHRLARIHQEMLPFETRANGIVSPISSLSHSEGQTGSLQSGI
jgi:hypothetical protein